MPSEKLVQALINRNKLKGNNKRAKQIYNNAKEKGFNVKI